ncbi:hypothetical protein TSUD_288950 [Trifolium subterraneum]|uniref:Uncharacterized protein n=1 Tax=Trifolium subterraneum TaxID=3900 RepID=A0A2Z6MSY3_TRISU|nr:hypothetical protein TSUD_288950 [Trifolium subterraneum]
MEYLTSDTSRPETQLARDTQLAHGHTSQAIRLAQKHSSPRKASRPRDTGRQLARDTRLAHGHNSQAIRLAQKHNSPRKASHPRHMTPPQTYLTGDTSRPGRQLARDTRLAHGYTSQAIRLAQKHSSPMDIPHRTIRLAQKHISPATHGSPTDICLTPSLQIIIMP